MLNNSGVVAGAVINSGTFYNNPGATVNGGLTNTGTVYALGTLTGAISTPNTFDTFVVSGGPVTVSATTGVVSPMLGQTLYIGSISSIHSSLYWQYYNSSEFEQWTIEHGLFSKHHDLKRDVQPHGNSE